MALHKMVAAGHEPAGLLVMVNRELQRSWFHGADLPLLREIARSLDIPLLLCESGGGGLSQRREAALKQGQAQLSACVFRDISISRITTYLDCRERCDAAGCNASIALSGNRTKHRRNPALSATAASSECVRNADLPPSFLGRVLDAGLVEEMQRARHRRSAARTANITPSCWTARFFISRFPLRLP